MVIPRQTVLTGNWEALYEDVKACREACGDAHLKCILATGDLGTLTNVYKASVVAMLAGTDFIKTSTGKEGVNATFPVAFTMVRAIREYHEKFGIKIGFKPAGGEFLLLPLFLFVFCFFLFFVFFCFVCLWG